MKGAYGPLFHDAANRPAGEPGPGDTKERTMAHPGAYRGNKRQKELKRLEKQKEKREKRLLKKTEGPPEPGSEFLVLDNPESEEATPGEETPGESSDPETT